MTLEAVKSGVNLKRKGGSETRFLKTYCKQFKYNTFETEHRILEIGTFIQLSHFQRDKVLSYEVK